MGQFTSNPLVRNIIGQSKSSFDIREIMDQKKILIVKGVVAPRAAYEPVAAQIVLVDTAGVTSDNPRHFEYRFRRRPLFPLEDPSI